MRAASCGPSVSVVSWCVTSACESTVRTEENRNTRQPGCRARSSTALTRSRSGRSRRRPRSLRAAPGTATRRTSSCRRCPCSKVDITSCKQYICPVASVPRPVSRDPCPTGHRYATLGTRGVEQGQVTYLRERCLIGDPTLPTFSPHECVSQRLY